MTADSPKPHSLTDHRLGLDLDHVHDGFADHDHDFPDEGPLEQNPIWLQDRVTLTSVGIDIGSSGTQVIFSRVHMRRLGEDLSSRYYVASRETLFASPVALTPYESEHRIDETALSVIITQAYATAGLASADIDTGVVILTGEALRRENAEPIAGVIAGRGGDLVAPAPGITWKPCWLRTAPAARRYRMIATSAFSTSILAVARPSSRWRKTGASWRRRPRYRWALVVVDDAGRITRLDPAGRLHAERAGFDWHGGDVIAPADLDEVAGVMAEALVAAVATAALRRGRRSVSDRCD